MGRTSRLLGSKRALVVLGVLVLVDLAFVLLHDLNNHGAGAWGHVRDARFDISRDHGYAELFGYSKLALIVGAFAFVYWATRQRLYAVWCYVLAIALVDDAGRLHERGKETLESSLDGGFLGAAAAEFGDLAVWSGLAVLIGLPLVVAHRRSSGDVRSDSRIVGALFVALVLLAVVVDQAVDFAINLALAPESAAGLRVALEEGGEQIVLSMVAAFALLCAHREWRQRLGEGSIGERADSARRVLAPPVVAADETVGQAVPS